MMDLSQNIDLLIEERNKSSIVKKPIKKERKKIRQDLKVNEAPSL